MASRNKNTVSQQEAAAEHALRMRAIRFAELVRNGELAQCRKELEANPELLATLEAHYRDSYAMQEMSLQELQEAVARGAIDAKAKSGIYYDLMRPAAKWGRVDVMQWLWSDRGALGYELSGLSRALLEACGAGQLEAARWLLDSGVPAGGTGADDVPLVVAASEGSVPVIELLLERGADPNARDSSGYFPLQMGTRHGKPVIELLLRAGADPHMRWVNEKDDLEGGLLSVAIASQTEGADEAFGYFLGIGLDPRDNADALLQAAEESSCPYVQTMLDLGADVNYQGRKAKLSALMIAVSKESLPVVELLLKRGADPNLADSDGRTALVVAATSREPKIEIIDRLIAAGATPASVQGSKTFWQRISKQKPELKRHIKAQLLSQRVQDAMNEPAEQTASKPGSGGPGPL